MATRLERRQERRRTATQFTSENPILAVAEWGIESDTGGAKVGDGTTAWNSLPYATARRGDLTMQTPTIAGGVAQNGSIRGVQHIKFPWSYTQATDPTDVAIGTAVYVPIDVTITAGGGLGPQFQTGQFGPRGIFELAGAVKYGAHMGAVAFAPIGYRDFLTLVNTPGVARNLVPSWSYLSCRQVFADGATATLGPNDTAAGGAAFVDTPAFGTVDSGTLDGTTNSYEILSFLSGPVLWGNAAITRRVGLDIKGVVTQATGGISHWHGIGTIDAPTGTLTEDIGVRVGQMSLATTKTGVQSEHRLRLYTQANTLDALAFIGIEFPDVNLTASTASWDFRILDVQTNIVGSENSAALLSGIGFNFQPTFKNANTEAQTFAQYFGENQAPLFQGDGAALTHGGFVAFRDASEVRVINSGSVAMTAHRTVLSAPTIDTSATVTTRIGFGVSDFAGAGTVTTQIGYDVAALTKGGTNIGIRNASPYVATPAAQTLSAAGNAITATAEVKALTNSTGGSLTLTSAPTIADGQTGQEIELVNVGAQDIVIQDQGTLASSNLRLTATTLTLQPRDSVRLRFNSTIGDWVQCGALVNVL